MSLNYCGLFYNLTHMKKLIALLKKHYKIMVVFLSLCIVFICLLNFNLKYQKSLFKPRWKGVYVVMPTPLLKDESLDIDGISHLVNYYIDSGVNFKFVICGK